MGPMKTLDMARGAAGGAVAGVALAALDLLTLATRDRVALDAEGWRALLGVAVCVGAALGLVPGVFWGLCRPLRGPVVTILSGAMAFGAFVADVVVLPRLYPWLHAGLAGAAVLAAALAGAAIWPERWARSGALVALLAAGLAPALLTTLGEGRQAVRQAVAEQTRYARHAYAALGPQTVDAPRDDGVCPWPTPPSRPGAPLLPRASVLLLTVDALRADHGGAALATHLPKTAAHLADGWRFDRVYAGAPRTNESVYSLFTGRPVPFLDFKPVGVDAQDQFVVVGREETRGQRRSPAPIGDTTPTWAEAMRDAGWQTFATAGYVYFLPAAGLTRGFERVDDTPYQKHNRDLTGLTSNAVADALIAAFAARDTKRPLFAWAHFMDPHAPYRAYAAAGTSPDERDPLTLFRSELRRVDDALDRVLSDPNLPPELLIVLTGDHGEEFGEHGGGYHGTTLFEEQVRVPVHLAARGRPLPAPPEAPESAPLALYDLMPTVLELVGVPTPPTVLGRSWASRLRGEPLADVPLLLSSTLHRTLLAVVEGTDKVVLEPATGIAAYYDLAADPAERANRIDAAPERVGPMACRLATVARGVRP